MKNIFPEYSEKNLECQNIETLTVKTFCNFHFSNYFTESEGDTFATTSSLYLINLRSIEYLSVFPNAGSFLYSPEAAKLTLFVVNYTFQVLKIGN